MKKKLSILAVIAILAVASFATLAYLTDSADAVTNTFTVGDIDIELEEEFDEDPKIYPGAEITKKPVVTVLANSEPTYLYIFIDNKIGEDAKLDIDGAKWIPVGTSGKVFRYFEIVQTDDDSQEFTMFTKVTFDGTLTKEDLEAIGTPEIVVAAYAHQAVEVDLAVANTAAITHFGVTP